MKLSKFNIIASFMLAVILVPYIVNARCQLDTTEIYRKASPAVVSITAIQIDPFSVEDRLKISTGSGFIVDPTGYIITNSHVVFGKKALMVELTDGRKMPAQLVGADPLIDLAVLKIGFQGGKLDTIPIAPPFQIKVGQSVLAIGHPLGFEQTVTKGIISGIDRILPISPMSRSVPMIQTDASINPGNSGGPLLNDCGEAVGVNTSGIVGAENIGFAVPASLIREAYPQLVNIGRIIRPWIGINGRLIKKSEMNSLFKLDVADGFLIETVEPDSPAEMIGLVGGLLQIQVATDAFLFGGDIITSINGRSLKDENIYLDFVKNLKVGNKVNIEVYRQGRNYRFTLEAVERPILPWDLPREH